MASTYDGNSPAIRHTVKIDASPEEAFEHFTEAIGSWWPAENTFSKEAFETVIIEPHEGGRWYERDEDGREIPWGQVLAWEPPHRIVLTWQITPQGLPEPDPAKASEFEVRFVPESQSNQSPQPTTRVEIDHRAFERHGDEGGAIWREAMDSEEGWPKFLGRYAASV